METKELVNKVFELMKESTKKTEQEMVMFLECIERALEVGESVSLPLFGTFMRRWIEGTKKNMKLCLKQIKN